MYAHIHMSVNVCGGGGFLYLLSASFIESGSLAESTAYWPSQCSQLALGTPFLLPLC